MRKPIVKKLGDEFGDYCLMISCTKCRHSRSTDPSALARIAGWSITLDALAKRLRCSACGAKECTLTTTPRMRPRKGL